MVSTKKHSKRGSAQEKSNNAENSAKFVSFPKQGLCAQWSYFPPLLMSTRSCEVPSARKTACLKRPAGCGALRTSGRALACSRKNSLEMGQGERPLYVPLKSRPGLQVTSGWTALSIAQTRVHTETGLRTREKELHGSSPSIPIAILVCPLLSGDRVRKKTVSQGGRAGRVEGRQRKGEWGDLFTTGKKLRWPKLQVPSAFIACSDGRVPSF